MIVDGQLNSMRRLIETISDLNTTLLHKLTKMDAAVEILISNSSKMERRVELLEGKLGNLENLGNEWMVPYPLFISAN